MPKHRYTEGVCGEVRINGRMRKLSHPSVPSVVRYSGAAKVYLLYQNGEYIFEIYVDGMMVNKCAIGPIASMPEWKRKLPEAYDDSAKSALSWTVHEMREDPEQPGMESGMDWERFEGRLEHDEDYEIVVRRSK